MSLLFLSDLHIQAADSIKAIALHHFLTNIPEQGDVIVFGGDIFDLFVGNKNFFKKKYAQILEAIKFVLEEKNCQVYYLEGNHDFHLKGLFRSENFVVKDGDFTLRFGKLEIYVTHGDLIDPADKGYRFLRFITRSLPLWGLVRVLPGEWIQNIGGKSSKQSRKYNNEESLGKESRDRLRRLYLDFARQKTADGYQLVLIGHSHLSDDIAIACGAKVGRYINLGFSSDKIPYLRVSASGEDLSISAVSGNLRHFLRNREH